MNCQYVSSDPSSVLGGVRLPPDTEIIKYTSSLAGPKVIIEVITDTYNKIKTSTERILMRFI